jgi:hypothetical protein
VGGIEFWDPNVGFGGPIIAGTRHVPAGRSATGTIEIHSPRSRVTTTTSSTPCIRGRRWTRGCQRRSACECRSEPIRATRTGRTSPPSHRRTRRTSDQGGWTGRVSDAITAAARCVEVQASALDTGRDRWLPARIRALGRHPRADRRAATSTSRIRHAQTIEHGMRVQLVADERRADPPAGHRESRPRRRLVMDSAPCRCSGRTEASRERSPSSSDERAGRHRHVSARSRKDTGRRARGSRSMPDCATTIQATPAIRPRHHVLAGRFRRTRGCTTLSGSAGLFADAMPLNALAFQSLPVRVISVPARTVQPPASNRTCWRPTSRCRSHSLDLENCAQLRSVDSAVRYQNGTARTN